MSGPSLGANEYQYFAAGSATMGYMVANTEAAECYPAGLGGFEPGAQVMPSTLDTVIDTSRTTRLQRKLLTAPGFETRDTADPLPPEFPPDSDPLLVLHDTTLQVDCSFLTIADGSIVCAPVRISEPVFRQLPDDRRAAWHKQRPPATYTLAG